MKKRIEKKGIVISTLIFWIIAIGVLVLLIVIYVILRGKGINAIEFVKNLFRFKIR